ncbi:MAG: S8 family serine peptidase [Clostridia bacterium]|nr:S8 family serine peptidase [Clostridia bacterium]
MNNTDYNAANFNRGRYTINAIKKIATIVVAIFFVLGCMYVPGSEFVGEAHAADGIAGNYVEGEVIVSYVDTKDMNLTSSQEKKIDNTLGDAEEIMTLEDVSLADVDVDESKLVKSARKSGEVDETLAKVSSDTESTTELISEIEKLPNVSSVEPNYIFSVIEDSDVEQATVIEEPADSEDVTTETNEEENTEAVEVVDETKTEQEPTVNEIYTGGRTGEQWAYNNAQYGMNVPNWNNSENINADGTVVAVLDTGVNYNHEDLKNVMWKDEIGVGGGTYGKDCINHDNDPMDDHHHGTHCAGIVAAQWNNTGISGAANGTKIMAVKAGASNGGFSYDAILQGYEYIIKAKQKGVNVVAINNSWGGSSGRIDNLLELIDEAGALGIVSVFASGNDGSNCDAPYTFVSGGDRYISYNLCYFLKDNPYVVTVNSITSSGAKASSSNYGAETTDLGAPGDNIISTLISGYGYMSGTSMATPAVTGEAAIISAEFSGAPADVRASIITGNTKSNSNLADKCKTGGQADVTLALSADPHELQYGNFKLSAKSFTYDGTGKKPEVIANKLEEGKDYEVIYQDDVISAGTHKVIVNALGDYYAGSVELTYTINKATPQVSLRSGGYIYDGGVKSNAVTVKGADGATWTNGNQYKLSGTLSAKMPGTYSVTVTPTDTSNYNAVSKSFSISVQPTTIKSLSGAKKAFKVKAAKKGKNYVTGYQVRYSLNESMSGAKTKTIGTKYSRVSKKVTKLKAKKTYYVQVRSYKTISKKKYYSSWNAVKSVKTK